MMNFPELLKAYTNKTPRKRTIGRYYASEVSGIIKGYKKPEDFSKIIPIDLAGCRMIQVGNAMEDQLTKIFEYNQVDCTTQDKKVIQINEAITLVVKPDFIFKDFLIETKFPFSPMRADVIPLRYQHQLECEYRAFYKTVYLGVLTTPMNLRLIQYRPSKRRWNNICAALVEFHSEVLKYNK